jgi:hypothetical protein
MVQVQPVQLVQAQPVQWELLVQLDVHLVHLAVTAITIKDNYGLVELFNQALEVNRWHTRKKIIKHMEAQVIKEQVLKIGNEQRSLEEPLVATMVRFKREPIILIREVLNVLTVFPQILPYIFLPYTKRRSLVWRKPAIIKEGKHKTKILPLSLTVIPQLNRKYFTYPMLPYISLRGNILYNKLWFRYLMLALKVNLKYERKPYQEKE